MGLPLLTIHLNRTISMKQTTHLEVSPLKPQLELHRQADGFTFSKGHEQFAL